MSAAILPFPARESAVPIGEMSRDELQELLDQIGQITSVFTYTAPEERPCIHWWQSFSTAERRRLLKRYGHPVNAWRAHNAGKSHP